MKNDREEPLISYRQVLNLVIVVFFLYLLGDALYRWEGFRYYSSFSEFIPGLALITILWSIVAFFASTLIWIVIWTSEWICLRIGLKIKRDHGLLFVSAFLLLGTIVWISKRKLQISGTTLHEKFIVLLCVTFIAILITWIFRNRIKLWMRAIQERIVPLLWLVRVVIILSLPLFIYYNWIRQTDSFVLHTVPKQLVYNQTRPNIILVIFDTLTARDMSVYGYQRLTTPFISEWANDAYIFTGLESESNITKPTTSSLMTGKRLWTHQVYHNIEGSNKPIRSRTENMVSVLQESGYYTMAFVVNAFASVKTLGIEESFDIAPIPVRFRQRASLVGWMEDILNQLFSETIPVYNWIIKDDFAFFGFVNMLSPKLTNTEVPPEKAFNAFWTAIDNNPSKQPFFAWIHLLPPHTPYLAPEPYRGIFNSSSKNSQGKFELDRAKYDEFIRYCDKKYEDFISEFMMRNELRNTIIIFSSDHGESFEHNYKGHGGPHLYEQVTNIPLIIKEPQQSAGKIINDIVEQVDISSTILDLVDIPIPSWMEGRSLKPLMRGEKLVPQPAFSMNLAKNIALQNKISKGTIAVWEGDYKLIHYLDENRSILFNLKKDPDEINDITVEESEITRRLLKLIQDNLEMANKRNNQ